MAGRLLRRLRRNAGSVLSVFVRDVLLRGKNLVGLAALAVGLAALAQGVGALLAGALVSTAVFGLVGGIALYGATESVLGEPLRGTAVVLAGLLLVGGGAHALGVGPADTGTEDADVTLERPDDAGWTESGHSRAAGSEDLGVYGDGDTGVGHGLACGGPMR